MNRRHVASIRDQMRAHFKAQGPALSAYLKGEITRRKRSSKRRA
jgi:hypothetical protein